MLHKKLRRMILLIVTVSIMLSCVSSVTALQSRVSNYSDDYELTGYGPTDMLAIAFAQLEKTGKQLGYSEEWCCDFVSDCAILAGQVDAIPSFAYCAGLYNAILDAGGKKTTSKPQPGDICFINWNGGKAMKHVEIVYKVENGLVYTIGGNTGGGENLYERRVFTHDPLPSENIVVIVRPDYKVLDMSYATKCTSYPSYCKIQIMTDGAAVMSQPCTADTDSESTVVTTAAVGSEYTAVGLYKNTLDQLWYRVGIDGETAYISSADAVYVASVEDLTISNLAAPESFSEGEDFVLKGKVETVFNHIASVSAWVSADAGPISGADVTVNGNYFSLQNTKLQKGLDLSGLKMGNYHLTISAALTGYYAGENDSLLTYSVEAELYSCDFTVEAHVCSFDTFSHYASKHPHYAVYECDCGETKQKTSKTTEMEDCEICFPPPTSPVPYPEENDLRGDFCFHPFFAECILCKD